MKSEAIEAIRKRYKNEWLLIAVDTVDPLTSTPIRGHLIGHGARRQDVHEISKQYEGVAYIVHSDEWPEDLAACFVVIL